MDTRLLSDQERAEYDEELKAVIGDNVAAYEHVLQSLAEIRGASRAERKAFIKKRYRLDKSGAWLGFVLPISFFWYRKMWLDGIGITALYLAYVTTLDAVFGSFEDASDLFLHMGAFGILTVVFGKPYVMWRYRMIVTRYRRIYPDRRERIQRLALRGGTSVLGAALPFIALTTIFIVLSF